MGSGRPRGPYQRGCLLPGARWSCSAVAILARCLTSVLEPAATRRNELVQETFAACVSCDRIWIEAQTKAGCVRNGEHALVIQPPAADSDRVDERRTGQVFHQVGVSKRGRQLQVGGETDGGIPSVRDEAN